MTKRKRIRRLLAIATGLTALALAVPATAEPPGTKKWEFVDGIQDMSSFTNSVSMADDGTIYAGRLNGKFHAIWPNGTQRWMIDLETPIASVPAVADDGTIYIHTGFRLYAITPWGTMKWYLSNECLFWGDPAIAKDGTVYVGSLSSRLYAVNPDKTIKWIYQAPINCVIADPVIGRTGAIYFGTCGDNGLQEHRFVALRPDMTLKWEYTYMSPYGMTGSPAIGNQNLIYVPLYKPNIFGCHLYAFRTEDGFLKTTCQDPVELKSYHRTSPCIGEDGTVYMPTTRWRLCVYRPDGILLWWKSTGVAEMLAPAVADDGKFYICERGPLNRVYAYRPDGQNLWTQHWLYGTEGQSTSSPLITDQGVMYIGCYHSVKAIHIDSPGPANSAWPMHRANRKRNARVDKYFLSIHLAKFLIKDRAYQNVAPEVRKPLDAFLRKTISVLQDEQPALAFELLEAFSQELENLGRHIADRDMQVLLTYVDEIREQIIATMMEDAMPLRPDPTFDSRTKEEDARVVESDGRISLSEDF